MGNKFYWIHIKLVETDFYSSAKHEHREQLFFMLPHVIKAETEILATGISCLSGHA